MTIRRSAGTWFFPGLIVSYCAAVASCSAGGGGSTFPANKGGAPNTSKGGGGSETGGLDNTSTASGGSEVGAGGALLSPITPSTGAKAVTDGCVPASCHPLGGDYCGLVGNGCGSTMDCGTCSKSDWVCQDGICRGGSSCRARMSCTEGAAKYCGKIGDDCGGELDCGDCTAPEQCGGSGTPNMCGDPNCQPISCSLPVGKYCGVVGDGCGHALDCGTCPDGAACGGDGTPGVCPGSSNGIACSGIKCNVEKCGNGTTSVSGVVYDPGAINPLYNVTVYIPNAPLDPIPTGATCEQCTATLSGQPIATALTDAKGHFRLEGVPTGTNIPLVMQVGRWRRQVTIPKVDGCTETVLSDRQLTRLPRNKSEGAIPRIAITTGMADALECLIPRIGIDRSEVTTDSGDGRIHLYAGGQPDTGDAGVVGGGRGGGLGGILPGGGAMGRGATSMTPGGTLPHASTLWGNAAKMRGYDIVLFSCEGGEAQPPKDAFLGNFQDYVDNGGRAFLTHYHYYWLNHGSAALKGTASYTGDDGTATRTNDGVSGAINTSFPKGAALADWLVAVGASTSRGQLMIYGSRDSLTTVNPPTQSWISLAAPPRTQYLTFNTPVGKPTEQQCGRVVFTDLHIGAAPTGQQSDTSTPEVPYPGGCLSTAMSPQIKALEFIFFDLAACVTPDIEMPIPPTPPPPTQAPPPTFAAPPPPQPPPPPVPQ